MFGFFLYKSRSMTKREKEILDILKTRPMISQKDLAKRLGITRSSVAGHIMNLTNKGLILGKGYIIKQSPYAVAIGGANMDIQGFPAGALVPRDSNPGKVRISCGGVARNISENLARLGVDVKLLTVLGADSHGHQLIRETQNAGVDMSEALILPGETTSTYLSILDDRGDMALALSGMEIMNSLNREYIRSRNRTIANASLIILDANLSAPVLEHITKTYSHIPILADPVSSSKVERFSNCLSGIHTLKPNAMEAGMISGVSCTEEKGLRDTAEALLKKGVKNVVISRNDRGIFFLSHAEEIQMPNPEKLPGTPVNATGAGDAFLAGLAWSLMAGEPAEEQLKKGLAASALTLCHENTINPEISAEKIELIIKENYS